MNKPLTTDQLRFFDEQGYLVIKDAVPDELLKLIEDPARKWVDRVINKWNREGLLHDKYVNQPFDRRLYEAWKDAGKPNYNPRLTKEVVSPEIFSFITNALFIDTAKSLTSCENLFAIKLFHFRPKLPSGLAPDGRNRYIDTPWHQDVQYHPYAHENPRLLVIWIPLVDVDESRSCLQVAAGCHKSAVYENVKVENYCSIKQEDLAHLSNFINLPMKRGDMLCMNAKLPHRALANTTDKIRWSIDIRYEGLEKPEQEQRNYGFICSHRDASRINHSYEQYLKDLECGVDNPA